MRARALPAARELAARGHEVTLIMPPWHTPDQAGRSWWDVDGAVRLEYLPLGGQGLPVLGHGIIARRLVRRAMAGGPDLVHAFKPKAYSGLAAAEIRLRQRLGSRTALVVDSDDWEGPGGWNELEGYGRAMRWVFAHQEHWGLRHADALTVASRALETLVWALGVPPGRVTYLPNALDQAQWQTLAASGTRTGGRPATLLLYTRFFEFDRQRPLAVLAQVRASVSDARLAVVGRGLKGEEQQFLELAAQMGLAGAVDYWGWLEPAQWALRTTGNEVALYPFDDTLVNRTKSSVKLLELMAAGLPVVADAVGQNAEVIETGQSGILVPPGDVVAMAEAAVYLFRNEQRRRELGEGARRRVGQAFRWSRQVEQLEETYRRALTGRAGQAGRAGASASLAGV